ncbi:MAG: arginine--tRNA ligase [Gemmataceae bacterium]|nr:arginine--tRNA ligase [Gemmataceae bacterium]
MNLLTQLRGLFEPVLAPHAGDPGKLADYLGMIRPAANPDHGDYQANFAMPLAKATGKKPPELAKEVVAALPANDLVESATVAGPGFINLKLKSDFLAAAVRGVATDPRLGVPPADPPKRYVIDYSSPNVAKPLHVGHLRSTIIGDALARVLRFQGHTVVTDNHLGDWGTQFGMLIYGYRNFLDQAAYEADPVRELARLYVHVRNQFKQGDDEDEGPTDDPVKKACQEETAKLHAGDPANLALWNQFMPHCLAEVQAIYDRLGILPFDFEHGESFYNPMLQGVVDDLIATGTAAVSQGAVVVPNAAGKVPTTPEELKKEEPPAIVRKRDGAFTYTTSDLATVRYRVEHFRPDAMLYVVDFRQALHFKTFFAQARRMGYDRVELTHISFGSVLGENRRPFATRSGGVPELGRLIDEAVQLGLAKYEESYESRKASGHDVPDLTDAVKRDIAEAVGVGAIKYGDLSQNRTSDYVFSYDKMLATEGNTATYMQYAYARCCAIFRKENVDPARFRSDPPAVVLAEPAERALALQLLRFPEAVDAAAADYLPHLVTGYLWDLAKSYSVFFESCPVLKAPSPELRDSRLLLVDLVARVIRQALDLLGIRVVERM